MSERAFYYCPKCDKITEWIYTSPDELECEHVEEDEAMTKDEMWDALLEQGVSEQTLEIVTAINGYSEETMEDVLYAHTGYRGFDQLEG